VSEYARVKSHLKGGFLLNEMGSFNQQAPTMAQKGRRTGRSGPARKRIAGKPGAEKVAGRQRVCAEYDNQTAQVKTWAVVIPGYLLIKP